MVDISKYSENTKLAMLYSAVAGLILSDIIPGFGDFFYIKFHRTLRDKWANGEIDAKTYWRKELGNYYLLNSAYWALVGTAMFFTPKFENKIKVGLGLIGAGAVGAIILKYIHSDETEKLSEKNAYKTKLLQNADPKLVENFIAENKK
jgi:hypothetical protein